MAIGDPNEPRRRGGLGRRLSDITAELDIQYPAYEGLFRKTPTKPVEPLYPIGDYDESYYTGERATEFSAPKEETPSFASILKEAKLLDTYFDKHIVGGEESGGGRDSSSRVAAFMYCLPEGTLATQTAIIDMYLSLKRDGYEASELLNEFEAYLYVQWRRGNTRASEGYVSYYSGLTINDFLAFWKAESLGKHVETLSGYERYSEFPA